MMEDANKKMKISKDGIEIINTFDFHDKVEVKHEEKVLPVKTKKKAIQEYDIDDKTKKKNLQKPLKRPFDEIYAYIFDLETMTFNVIETDVYNNNELIVGDFTYKLDRRLIFGPLNGYDIKRDILSMFKIIPRFFSPKRIGVLFFIQPSLMEIPEKIDNVQEAIEMGFTKNQINEINESVEVAKLHNEELKTQKVEPITFEDMKQDVMMKIKKQRESGKGYEDVEVEVVPCEPCLLKVIVTNTLYEDMIRSYKRLETKAILGKWWKVILVAMVIVVIIIVITQTGILQMITNGSTPEPTTMIRDLLR